ncbi:MAG: alkaline phosphatase family protein [Propionibacteriaceae bacterium]|nr:alkaline phosphatase family protein [Propionibacteriaceae bacterium]
MSLPDLLVSIGAHLGMPGEDTLGLPDAPSYVLLVADGLGWNQLEQYPVADILRGPKLRVGLPSTTATSLTSLGTGLAPGRHGVAGYSFRFNGELLPVLRWPRRLSGVDVQPQLTYLERMAAAGVHVAKVMPASFEKSGLTTAALRGGEFWGLPDEAAPARIAALAAAAVSQRSFTYVYDREPDHAGHAHGVGSAQWIAGVIRIAELVRLLRRDLPPQTVLVVTGDHGMVNVPKSHHINFEDHPELAEQVVLLGGEARFRQVYTSEPEAVAARWREVLGERALVVTREQAMAERWFGTVEPRNADRFGDVLAAALDDWAIMTKAFPKEHFLVGMHGSVTDAEREVPLLVLPG